MPHTTIGQLKVCYSLSYARITLIDSILVWLFTISPAEHVEYLARTELITGFGHNQTINPVKF